VALSGGELYYFELNELGQLAEIDKLELNKEVACVALAPLPAGAARARFVAVGDHNSTVELYSLALGAVFEPVAQQVVPAQPHSLCLVEMGAVGGGSTQGGGAQLYLNIGLSNGVLLRTVVDALSGALSDTRTRFVGTRAVRLFAVSVAGGSAVLALSSRAWLCYNWQTRFHMTPLSYMPLEYGAGFASEQCPEGLVAVHENTVRIIAFDRLGDMFNVSFFHNYCLHTSVHTHQLIIVFC
jgi:splicing factor 3B subunit 3